MMGSTTPPVAGAHWFEACRYVVEHHQYVYLNAATGAWSTHRRSRFTILDAVTASGILQIHDALGRLDAEQKDGKSNRQATFRSWPFVRAHQLLCKTWRASNG